MAMDRPRGRPSASLEAAIVARRYYLDNRQKSEIAEELGLSRFKVARLLDEARESGIVRIHVDVPTDIDLDLGDRVAHRFGIARVLAARSLPDGGADDAVVGAAAAQYLESVLGSQDVLGISWGRALTSTVEAFSARTMTDVVQVVGGVNAGGSAIGGVELARRMAAATGGAAYPLNAPLLVGSAEIARALRGDASLAAAIDRFPALTFAVLGVGSWDPPHSAVATELDERERAQIVAAGAVADVCGILLDGQGDFVDSPLTGRTVGVSLDDLRRIPEVVAVAGGIEKTRAIAAVLRSGFVSTLVTDVQTARLLLES
ncbi:sugar-binding transcriptional regulator [Microbacterium sp. VKM Ac-2923]|uniref:sugar-binding transcriptional regulator n=1 Tax=Microbacterium sp. VKM Ac-2923 TaxID=2929476 RepID=UPI001FB2A68C|nr:sugar-binding domain-containing protein [Microbacterium sp. VKM Ac-2923]MCJ1707807.1 transcriptional regulator [Microbacterium sp. VKM Ac-2923]